VREHFVLNLQTRQPLALDLQNVPKAPRRNRVVVVRHRRQRLGVGEAQIRQHLHRAARLEALGGAVEHHVLRKMRRLREPLRIMHEPDGVERLRGDRAAALDRHQRDANPVLELEPLLLLPPGAREAPEQSPRHAHRSRHAFHRHTPSLSHLIPPFMSGAATPRPAFAPPPADTAGARPETARP
jgi:hypothetical protein